MSTHRQNMRKYREKIGETGSAKMWAIAAVLIGAVVIGIYFWLQAPKELPKEERIISVTLPDIPETPPHIHLDLATGRILKEVPLEGVSIKAKRGSIILEFPIAEISDEEVSSELLEESRELLLKRVSEKILNRYLSQMDKKPEDLRKDGPHIEFTILPGPDVLEPIAEFFTPGIIITYITDDPKPDDEPQKGVEVVMDENGEKIKRIVLSQEAMESAVQEKPGIVLHFNPVTMEFSTPKPSKKAETWIGRDEDGNLVIYVEGPPGSPGVSLEDIVGGIAHITPDGEVLEDETIEPIDISVSGREKEKVKEEEEVTLEDIVGEPSEEEIVYGGAACGFSSVKLESEIGTPNDEGIPTVKLRFLPETNPPNGIVEFEGVVSDFGAEMRIFPLSEPPHESHWVGITFSDDNEIIEMSVKVEGLPLCTGTFKRGAKGEGGGLRPAPEEKVTEEKKVTEEEKVAEEEKAKEKKGDATETVSTPTSPPTIEKIASIDTPGNAIGVQVDGKLAFVNDRSSLRIIDVTDPRKPEVVASFGESELPEFDEILDMFVSWPVTLATDASFDLGLVIIDVLDPTVPKVGTTGILPINPKGVVSDGELAFIAGDAGGVAGLVIVDMSDQANPKVLKFLQMPPPAGGAIELDSVRRLVYMNGNGSPDPAKPWDFTIVDISDPKNPKAIGGLSGVGGTDIFAGPGFFVYVVDPITGFSIIDTSSPSNPKKIGFLSGKFSNIFVHGNLAFLAGETIRKEVVKDGRLVVEFSQRLEIIDVIKPVSPENVDSFEVPGFIEDVYVEGNLIYVANADKGLTILQCNYPLCPRR